jgi:hypothetical protein
MVVPALGRFGATIQEVFAICFYRGDGMAQGLDSTKSEAEPSHEAIESNAPATEVGRTEQQKMDDIAMQSAKRGENRFASNKDKLPEDTMFTK